MREKSVRHTWNKFSHKCTCVSRKNPKQLHKIYDVIIRYRRCKIRVNCVILNRPKILNSSRPNSCEDPRRTHQPMTNVRNTYEWRLSRIKEGNFIVEIAKNGRSGGVTRPPVCEVNGNQHLCETSACWLFVHLLLIHQPFDPNLFSWVLLCQIQISNSRSKKSAEVFCSFGLFHEAKINRKKSWKATRLDFFSSGWELETCERLWPH